MGSGAGARSHRIDIAAGLPCTEPRKARRGQGKFPEQFLCKNVLQHQNMNGVLEEKPEARQSRRDHVRERKRQLEEELRTIQQQRAQLEQQLQALTSDHLALPGPSKAARPGNRAALPSQFVNVGGAAERAQVYAERERRVTALFQQCGTIHKNVKANQKALSFIEPVDPVKLKILDYFSFVKKPMALADVAGKLAHNPAKGIQRKYKSVYEFRDDMRQIWENCRIYNPIGQPVRTNGDWMSEYWEKKWAASGLEAKWEEEMVRQRQEDLVSSKAARLCSVQACKRAVHVWQLGDCT